MDESTTREQERRNKPWRRLLRRRLWFFTRRGRLVHDLKQKLGRAEASDA